MTAPTTILKGSQLAREVYSLGWIPDVEAGPQYLELGEEIRAVAENLESVDRIIENAVRQLQDYRPEAAREEIWDSSSTNEILGDFNQTLADCKHIVQQHLQFGRSQDVIHNFQWNNLLQPRIERLRERVKLHNLKAQIFLQPLEYDLLSSVYKESKLLGESSSISRGTFRLGGYLISDIGTALAELRSEPNPLPQVPDYLAEHFEEAAECDHPSGPRKRDFPLRDGTDTFIYHFDKSTTSFKGGRFLNERSPPPTQYFNLMKCVWIMGRIEASEELRFAPSGSHWPRYIRQLREDLSQECGRFTARSSHCLLAPNLQAVTEPFKYDIWLYDSLPNDLAPTYEAGPVEEVLHLHLPTSSAKIERTLCLSRFDPFRFSLVEKVVDRSAKMPRTREQRWDMDLRTVTLVPLYAKPGPGFEALNVMFKTENRTTSLLFGQLKHVHKFQHALTGYKVFDYYDQSDVTVALVGPEAKIIEAKARIQLWLPKPLSTRIRDNISEDTTTTLRINSQLAGKISQISISNPTETRSVPSPPAHVAELDATNERPYCPSPLSALRTPISSSYFFKPVSRQASSACSLRSVSQPSSGLRIGERRSSDRNTSNSSSVSASRRPPTVSSHTSISSHASVSVLNTGSGLARLHEEPQRPMLVLFLQNKDTKQTLSILSVSVDQKTIIERQRCSCSRPSSSCKLACIERTDGPLLAQRYVAAHNLEEWNLAGLGLSQRKELPHAGWANLKRITIKFKSQEERELFAGGRCECRPKTDQDLKACVLAGHEGLFGKLRYIGTHRLRDYCEAQEESYSNSVSNGQLWDA